VVHVPDAESHAVGRPEGRWRPVYDSPAGEVLYSDLLDCLYMTYEDRARLLCDPRHGTSRLSLVRSDAAASETEWLASHPLFTLPLIEMLKRRGGYNVHAAGLSLGGCGLLLAGTSGAGKSTLALALARAGWGFMGDDMLFLTQHGGAQRVLAFPDEVDAAEQTLSLLPELRPVLERPLARGWPKRPVWIEDVYAADLVRECRPMAVVLPRVAHTEASVLTPIEPAEAFLSLAPNVLLTEPRSSQAHLDALGALVRNTACFRLETGRDLDAVPDLLRRCIPLNAFATGR